MHVGHWMATKKIWLPVNLGHLTEPNTISCIQWQPKATKTSLGPILGLWDVRSTIKCTFFSFFVLSSLHVKTLFALTINAIHLEESGSPLEGFKDHNANCENNCVLDLNVEPFGGPHIDLLYIKKNLTLIYVTLDLNFYLTLIYIYLFINGWWVRW